MANKYFSMSQTELFIAHQEIALQNALNKIASVKHGLACGFLNDVEATERILVIRNETEDEMRMG